MNSCALNNTDAEELAARYARGESRDDLTEFERHFLNCAECQERVRTAAAIIAAHVPPSARSPRPRPRGTWPVRRTWIGAALLAAAAIILVVRSSGTPDAMEALGAIATFDSPELAAVRSAGVSSADSGMAALSRGDARAAAELLQRALASDSSAGVAFYLGLAHMRAGDAARACDALGFASRRGRDGPFASDAAYLRAKAWLRLRQPDSALAVLAPWANGPAAAAARASAFADSIRRAR